VEQLFNHKDLIEPYLYRYQDLAVTIIADRTPINPRLYETIVVCLLESSCGNIESQSNYGWYAKALAQLSFERPTLKIVETALEVIVRIKQWDIRAAILLYAQNDTEISKQLLDIGAKDADPDVKHLSIFLQVRQGIINQQVGFYFKHNWCGSSVPELDQKVTRIIKSTIKNYFIDRIEPLLSHDNRYVRLNVAKTLFGNSVQTKHIVSTLNQLLSDEHDLLLRYRTADFLLEINHLSDKAQMILTELLSNEKLCNLALKSFLEKK
jgi:hypothetical protein